MRDQLYEMGILDASWAIVLNEWYGEEKSLNMDAYDLK